MPSKLLKEVADYCWSNSFLDIFRNFFAKHAELFEGAPLYLSGGEHNLQYWNLFQEYLKLYEDTLEVYLKKENIPLEEFYQEVRDEQNKSEDPYIQIFIDCLLASADYDSFYKVMAKEGHKSLTIKNLKKKTYSPSADAKADVKESYGDVKGTGGGSAARPAERLHYDEKQYEDRNTDEKKSYK